MDAVELPRLEESPIAIAAPDRRVRVFIGCTIEEVVPERLAAPEAIGRLCQTPFFVESGTPRSPQARCSALLARSDVFVGIYWQSNGRVAPGLDFAGIEDEYRLSEGKPRLVFIKGAAPELSPREAPWLTA